MRFFALFLFALLAVSALVSAKTNTKSGLDNGNGNVRSPISRGRQNTQQQQQQVEQQKQQQAQQTGGMTDDEEEEQDQPQQNHQQQQQQQQQQNQQVKTQEDEDDVVDQPLEPVVNEPEQVEQVKQEKEQVRAEVKGRPTRRPLPLFTASTRNPLEPPSDVRKKFNVLLRTSSGFNDKEGIAVSSGRTAVN